MEGAQIGGEISLPPRKKKLFDFKYKWCLRRFWWVWLKSDLSRFYYKNRWKFNMDGHGTMIPDTGKGKYISVYVKGKITQIVNEEYPEEIRIIPYQPNHGVMVEYWEKGIMRWRNHLDLHQLSKNIIFASNVEELTGREKTKRKHKDG